MFAVRDLFGLEETLGRAGFDYLQAPVRLTRVAAPLPRTRTYAHVLHNVGFSEAPGLLARIRAWRQLYRLVDPRLVLFDHSPTALLAARGMDFATAVLGTGFTLPPRRAPFPDLPVVVAPDDPSGAELETQLLGPVNWALGQTGIAALTRLCELFPADGEFLLTFPELDPYGARSSTPYWGEGAVAESAHPRWPDGDGPRVFAYLNPFPNVTALLDALVRRKGAVLVYGPKLPQRVRDRYSGTGVWFVPSVLDLRRTLSEATAAVLQGNHGTTCATLLAGLPALHLPLSLEQRLTALGVVRLGAGLAAPRLHPEGMGAQLNAVLEDASLRRNAATFARRYQGFDPAARDAELARTLGRWL